ncbi:hypothetical protein [Rhodopirellula sp. P2]|uniref:hypothetical protein n=1 Tax=Rhodopirellula sp. P2 TaxID=2127060 RepID=UPI0023683FF1|nr:hypothetical protein [Rhodopirellula sp. P2]WDQ14687.1 hypothetical protein PSR62_13645 [Rhodopirellula sp. P2]
MNNSTRPGKDASDASVHFSYPSRPFGPLFDHGRFRVRDDRGFPAGDGAVCYNARVRRW